MNAVIFGNTVIGFVRDGESVDAVMERHFDRSIVRLDTIPVSCKDYNLGTILCANGEYHRVVERVIGGWVSGSQVKIRSELIGKVSVIKLDDSAAIMIANVPEIKAAHTLELARMNSVITCLTNTLKNTETEADNLRKELFDSSNYTALISDKCERMLKVLARETSTQYALSVFNGTTSQNGAQNGN